MRDDRGSIADYCSNDALALVNPDGLAGQIVLQNAAPGTRGNLGQFTMEGPGSFLFNGNIKKSFQITESMSLQIRVDATNILNHPSPAAHRSGLTTRPSAQSRRRTATVPSRGRHG